MDPTTTAHVADHGAADRKISDLSGLKGADMGISTVVGGGAGLTGKTTDSTASQGKPYPSSPTSRGPPAPHSPSKDYGLSKVPLPSTITKHDVPSSADIHSQSDPTARAEEIRNSLPVAAELQGKLSSASTSEDAKRSIPTMEEVKSKLPSMEEAKSKIPSTQDVVNKLPSIGGVKRNFPSTDEVTSELPSTEDVKRNIPSTEEMKNKVQSSGEMKSKMHEVKPTVTGVRQRVRKLSTDLTSAKDYPAVQEFRKGASQQANSLRQWLGRSDFVKRAEAQTGIDRLWLVLGGITAYILLIPLNLFHLAIFTTNLLTFVPSMLLAIQNLEKPDDERTRLLLSYFVVFGFVQFLESLAPNILSRRIPQYFTIKLAFLAYLLHPRTKGGLNIHETVFRPTLKTLQSTSKPAKPPTPPTSKPHDESYSSPPTTMERVDNNSSTDPGTTHLPSGTGVGIGIDVPSGGVGNGTGSGQGEDLR